MTTRPTLRSVYVKLLATAALVSLLLAAPILIFVEHRAAKHRETETLLSLIQSITPMRARILSEAIQGNAFQVDKLLSDLRTTPGLDQARLVTSEATFAACRGTPLAADDTVQVCNSSSSWGRGLFPSTEPPRLLVGLTFAHRSYGTIELVTSPMSATTPFLKEPLLWLILLAGLSVVISYHLGVRLFRREIRNPIERLIESIETKKEPGEIAANTAEVHHLVERLAALIRSHTHAERMSAQGLMAAEVAHDLKQPLSTLKIFLGNAAARFQDPTFRERFTTHVPRALTQLERLSEDLSVDHAPVQRKREDLVGVVREILERLKQSEPLLTSALVFEPARTSIFAEVDRTAVDRLVTNLVENAVRTLNKNGRVRVRLEVEDSERSCVLSVKDDGQGMPAEHLTHIFEPFVSYQHGKGLGLAICNKLVTAHGGTISVNSKVGTGTTFRVSLPLAA